MQSALALQGRSAPARVQLLPGEGCLAAPGTWVLSLTGAAPTAVHPGTAPAHAPSPLQMAADVDRALASLPAPPLQVVLGADLDPLVSGAAWADAALAAALRVVHHGAGLRLVTRGAPGRQAGTDAWARLLARAVERGGAVLDLAFVSVDDALARLYEPADAPSTAARLAAATALQAAGVRVEAHIDPLLPWVSDTTARLDPLLRAIAGAGVRRVRARYVSGDADLARRLKRLPPAHRALLRGCLGPGAAASGGRLPEDIRRRGGERLHRLAQGHGLSATLCAGTGGAPCAACRLAPPEPARGASNRRVEEPAPPTLRTAARRAARSASRRRQARLQAAPATGKVVSLEAARAARRPPEAQLSLFG